MLDVRDPCRYTAEHSDSAYTMSHASAHLPPTLTFREHTFSTTFSFRISCWIIWRCIILLPPPFTFFASFLPRHFFSPVSSLIVLAPPTLPGRFASIGSLAEHCPFLLFLCLSMRRRKRRRRRRTRTFKARVNFNPTARSSVPENWTFVVTILRTLSAEWPYFHTFEHCLQNKYDRQHIVGILWAYRGILWAYCENIMGICGHIVGILWAYFGDIVMHSHLNRTFRQLRRLLQGKWRHCTVLQRH